MTPILFYTLRCIILYQSFRIGDFPNKVNIFTKFQRTFLEKAVRLELTFPFGFYNFADCWLIQFTHTFICAAGEIRTPCVSLSVRDLQSRAIPPSLQRRLFYVVCFFLFILKKHSIFLNILLPFSSKLYHH